MSRWILSLIITTVMCVIGSLLAAALCGFLFVTMGVHVEKTSTGLLIFATTVGTVIGVLCGVRILPEEKRLKAPVVFVGFATVYLIANVIVDLMMKNPLTGYMANILGFVLGGLVIKIFFSNRFKKEFATEPTKKIYRDETGVVLDRHKIGNLERKHNIIGFLIGVPLTYIGIFLAEHNGVNLKLWWSFFAVLAIVLTFIIASLHAQKAYRDTLFDLGEASQETKYARYVACRTKTLAYVFLVTPLIPLFLALLHLKVSSFLGIAFCIILIFGWKFADRKASDETGYRTSKL